MTTAFTSTISLHKLHSNFNIDILKLYQIKCSLGPFFFFMTKMKLLKSSLKLNG